jgi:hypothetical protein
MPDSRAASGLSPWAYMKRPIDVPDRKPCKPSAAAAKTNMGIGTPSTLAWPKNSSAGEA